MPVLVEINGLDEAGATGDTIIFARVGIPLPSELQVFLRNLEYFGRLIIGKNDVRGYDSSHLLKFVRDYIDDPSIDVTFFCMRIDVQVKLLREMLTHIGTEFFKVRGTMIESYTKKQWNVVSEVMNQFNRFRRPTIYLESFVKACGLHQIMLELPKISKLYSASGDVDRFLAVQIEGGYPFAFWWKQLTELPNGGFKKGAFSVVGISNGDEYYPSLSTAGSIAHILLRNPERRHLFPIREIREIRNLDMGSFYEEHKKAMTLSIFQKRLIFLGILDENVRRCIPYLLHVKDRSKTFEPFYIGKDVKQFFKEFGAGNPENNLVVYGGITSSNDRSNVKFCQENGYSVFHVSEFKNDFQELIHKIEEELELIPAQKRASLSSKLKSLESACISSLK